MPQNDAPTDFAALWAEYKASREHVEIVLRIRGQGYPGRALKEEAQAARALLDALTGDATLRELEQAFLKPEGGVTTIALTALNLIERLVLMGLLHGPEEGGDGE